MDNAMKDEKNLFSAQNDPGDKIYKSMYRDELAKASAGGFGFSQMLYDFRLITIRYSSCPDLGKKLMTNTMDNSAH